MKKRITSILLALVLCLGLLPTGVLADEATAPQFTALEFTTTALASGQWVKGQTYDPKQTEYSLTLNSSTVKLSLSNATAYDTELYTATASYVNSSGASVSVSIKNKAMTNFADTVDDMAFGQTDVTITIAEKADPGVRTDYVFHVTRPRDTTKVIKGTSGLVLTPDGRALSTVQYNGKAEGTFFQAGADGKPTTTTTITGTKYNYRVFVIGDDSSFGLTLTGSTAYQHLRYSSDEGQTWKELPQGGGKTEQIVFPEAAEGNSVAKVTVQILDDKTFTDNVKAEKNGFAEGTPNTYNIWVEQVNVNVDDIKILTAECVGSLDSYPTVFDSNITTNVYIVPNGTKNADMTYTVSEGATVKVGSTVATPDGDGVYTLQLKMTAQTISVTKDGVTKQYSFKLQARSAKAYADKVVDFLCINSQYTNGVGTGNAAAPWTTLSGSLSSLGNWGGYITYYFDTPLTDNPNNKYGMDFYAYGNANKDTSTATKMSFFEPGQVWVSEDGETWYALAGSAHYEDDVDWNYTVNYSKAANGKTAWTDNHGNSNDGTSKSGGWVSPAVYYMNDLSKKDQITLTGIMLPSADGTVTGSGATDAYAIKWGYVDALPNGTVGADTNPYVDNSDFSLSAAGFDLEWAVDQNGIPIDVSKMEFHYVKVVTASNIWHNSFAEKSTECSGVVRTTAQESAVGRTTAPASIIISDGMNKKLVSVEEGRQIYSVDVGDMKYISVTVNGAESDNIYVNNQRAASGEAVEGFKVTKEGGEKLIRVIVQNGDKEPCIYLLKLTGSASAQGDLIEDVRIDVSGDVRRAESKNGTDYTAKVGYRIDSIGIHPVAAGDVSVTINGAAVADSYELTEGKNTFTIVGQKDDKVFTATLVVTRETAPKANGTIKVYFTLLGDSAHGEPTGDTGTHTLADNNLNTWIARTAYTVDNTATVIDVIETALGQNGISYANSGGNYITSITYDATTLAEFTNGSNSGWMYTLNGRYPNLGVAEQTLKSGDVIVFHYSDDYTQEQGSESWGGGDSKEKKSETTTASLAPEVTAKNGEATAAVDSKAVSDAIAAAKADGAKEIVIAPVVKGSAGKVSVELPKTAVNDIVESSDAALNIQTDVGSIDIPNDTLSEILKAAGSTDIAMSVEKVNPTAVKDSLPAGAKLENAVAVEFSISSGDKTIASFGGKALKVSVPVDAKKFADGKTYTAFVVSADGKVETTTAKIVGGEAVVEMRHFSTVVITDQVAAAAFSDVAAGAYYYDAVQWAAANGVTAGTDDTHFSPNRPCTRAQVVTFLWRAAGCPKAEGKTPFTDVAADTYYSDAVTWAYEQGITGGTSATTFSPNTAVTRAQVVTFLYRYEKPAAGTAVNPFADVQKNAYYYDAVQWAYADGVTDGTDETHFSPNTVCTRGQIVTFLYRDFDSELSESSGVEMRLAEAAAYVLKTTPAPRFGSVGGEWAVLGLARSGSAVPESYYADYYTALEKTVSEAKGVLSTRKYTEYSRVIVALAAIGIDARNVAGYDLTVPLGDYDNTVKQGTSGPVWALIALDSRNYPMPICPDAATSATRQMYIDRLLATQNTDGGWGIGAESASDVDMTAMALQALAKYQEQKAVAAAAERALAFLETAPRVSSESTAQVITALCELGKPVPDELTEELIAYHVSGGGYCHVHGGGVNRMSSEQALYALAAVQRVQTGMPSLYRMER